MTKKANKKGKVEEKKINKLNISSVRTSRIFFLANGDLQQRA
jgi:hypothetical protein